MIGDETGPSAAVLDRIKKLLAMAEGAAAIGNAHEAEAFAAKATELAIRHKLELDDVRRDSLKLDPEEEIDGEFLGHSVLGGLNKRRAPTWVAFIANAVARANSCKVVIMHNGTILLAGTESDRLVARHLIQVLSNVGRRLGDEHYAVTYRAAMKAGDVTAARGCRKSFLTGFARGIEGQLIERLRSLRSELPNAVVVLDKAAERSNAWVRAAMPTKQSHMKGAANHQASFDLGHNTGKSTPLTPGVQAGHRSTAAVIAGMEQRRLAAPRS